MITLWVKPEGLRRQHDPAKPRLVDIRRTSRLAALADKVVARTSEGTFVLKDRSQSPLIKDRIHSALQLRRVFFDGRTLVVDSEAEALSNRDVHVLRAMQEAL